MCWRLSERAGSEKMRYGLIVILYAISSSVFAASKCRGDLEDYAKEVIAYELAGGHNFNQHCLGKQNFKYLNKAYDPPSVPPNQNILLVKDDFKVSKVMSNPKYPWKHVVHYEAYSANKGTTFKDSIQFITNKNSDHGCVRPISLPKQSMLFNSCKK